LEHGRQAGSGGDRSIFPRLRLARKQKADPGAPGAISSAASISMIMRSE